MASVSIPANSTGTRLPLHGVIVTERIPGTHLLTSKWDCLQSRYVLVLLMAKLDGRTLDHKTLEALRLLAVKRVP